MDYDHTTLAPVEGWVCVYCFGERACSDHFLTDPHERRVSDDGLCQYCRDIGRSGIGSLPEGFTLADEVAAYCQYLTGHYPAVAPGLPNALRRRSTGVVHGLVLAFLDRAQQAPPITALTPVALRAGRCFSCYAHDRLIDTDDLCDECRDLFRVAA
ncbi:hypothetical protein ACLMAL_36545 (plasmid) [Nocardia sp. CWNU-33]|uniref:hypothetical protein n=1 Tax=Nocardia sp. CWNU-33 TaxID=3392117 RepID=UPI00398EF03C